MDLTFKTPKGRFNYRVGAIIIYNNKILMAKNQEVDYYYSVGGRVKFGETAREAVIREAKEETGLRFEVDYLAFIHENFFEEKGFTHELSLFYVLKPLDDLAKIKCESATEDGQTESLLWIDLNEIANYKVFPDFYQTKLYDLNRRTIEWVSR